MNKTRTIDDEIKEVALRLKDLDIEQEDIVRNLMKIYDSASADFTQDELNQNLSARHKVIEKFDEKLIEQYGSDTALYAQTGMSKANFIASMQNLAAKHGKLDFNRDFVKASVSNTISNYHTGQLKQNAMYDLSSTDTPEARQKSTAVLESRFGLSATEEINNMSPDLKASLVQNVMNQYSENLGNPYFR